MKIRYFLFFFFVYLSNFWLQELHFYVDKVSQNWNQATIQGWVILDGIPSDSVKIQFYVGNDNTKIITPQIQKRPDVTAHFGKHINYDNSGFSIEIKKNFFSRLIQNDDLFVVLEHERKQQILKILDGQSFTKGLRKTIFQYALLILLIGLSALGLFFANKRWLKKYHDISSFSNFLQRFWSWITLISVVLFWLILYHRFVFSSFFYIYNDVGSDDWNSYLPFYQFFLDRIQNLNFSSWGFALGAGNNIWSIGAFWLDPFFPLLFITKLALPSRILLMTLVKSLFIAAIFFQYLRFFTKKSWLLWLGVVLYVFNAYIVIWGQHYFFLTSVFYFTFLLYGVEYFIQTTKVRWLLPALALGLAGSLYFMFYSCIFLFFYLLFRLWQDKKIAYLQIHFFKLTLVLIAAIGLAAWSILPGLEILNNSPRTAANFNIPLWYDFRSIIVNLSRFYSSILLGTNGYQGNSNFYEDFLVYTSILVPLLFLPYLINRWQSKQRWLSYLIILLLLLPMFSPVPSFLFNKFATHSTRYAFFYAVLGVLMLVQILQKPRISKFWLWQSFWLNLAFLVFLSYYLKLPTEKNTIVMGVFMLIYTLILSQEKIRISYLLPFFILGELFFCNYQAVFKERSVLNKAVIEQKLGYYDGTKDIVQKIHAQDDRFYRIYKNYISVFMNDGTFSGYYGFDTYNSLRNPYFAKFREKLDIKNGYIDEYWHIGDGPSIDDRLEDHLFLYSFLGAKYFIAQKQAVPFGYEKMFVENNNTVYRNNFALPVAFFYKKQACIQEEKFLALPLREFYFSQVYVDDQCTVENAPQAIFSDDFELLAKDAYRLEVQGRQIFIHFSTPLAYPVLQLKIQAEHLDPFFGHVYVQSVGQSDFTHPKRKRLAISREGEIHISLEYPQIQTLRLDFYNDFQLSTLEVYKNSFKNYTAAIEMLQEKAVDLVYHRKDENYFQGKYQALDSGILALSIPYDKNWKAKVNGEKVTLQKINFGFLGLPLKAGENTIEIYYTNDSFYWGLYLSLLTLSLGLGFLLLKKYRK